MVSKRGTDNQYGNIVAKVQEKWAKRVSSLAPPSKSYMQEKQVDFRLSREVSAGEVILDIGPAYPLDAIRWADLGCTVCSIDINNSVLKSARLISSEQVRQGTNLWVQASAVQLPFSDGTFDWVCDFSSIDHIPGHHNRQQAIREYARVKKREGKVIIVVPNRLQPVANWHYFQQWRNGGIHPEWGYVHCFTPWELMRMARCAGLRARRVDSEIMWTRFWRMERKWDTWLRHILTSLRASLPVLKWIGWRLGVLFE